MSILADLDCFSIQTPYFSPAIDPHKMCISHLQDNRRLPVNHSAAGIRQIAPECHHAGEKKQPGYNNQTQIRLFSHTLYTQNSPIEYTVGEVELGNPRKAAAAAHQGRYTGQLPCPDRSSRRMPCILQKAEEWSLRRNQPTACSPNRGKTH